MKILGFIKQRINCKIITHLALHLPFAFRLPTLTCGRYDHPLFHDHCELIQLFSSFKIIFKAHNFTPFSSVHRFKVSLSFAVVTTVYHGILQ